MMTVTRPCTKKSRHTPLTIRQVEDLLSSFSMDSSQGLRDSLMIRLMACYSLRVSEVAALAFSGEAYDKGSDSYQPLFFDIEAGLFSVHRIKTATVQVKRLDTEELEIARAYVAARPDCDHDFVFVGSRKGGQLRCEPMSISAINQRVRELGKEVLEVDTLSPHDFRHYWASNSTGDIDKLKDAGGWASYTMLNRYRHGHVISNEGVRPPGR